VYFSFTVLVPLRCVSRSSRLLWTEVGVHTVRCHLRQLSLAGQPWRVIAAPPGSGPQHNNSVGRAVKLRRNNVRHKVPKTEIKETKPNPTETSTLAIPCCVIFRKACFAIGVTNYMNVVTDFTHLHVSSADRGGGRNRCFCIYFCGLHLLSKQRGKLTLKDLCHTSTRSDCETSL
jgi:hypothetical protein